MVQNTVLKMYALQYVSASKGEFFQEQGTSEGSEQSDPKDGELKKWGFLGFTYYFKSSAYPQHAAHSNARNWGFPTPHYGQIQVKISDLKIW